MNCPKCGGDTHVYDTASDGEKVYRLRKCKSCGQRFYTTEAVSDCMYELHKIKNSTRKKG